MGGESRQTLFEHGSGALWLGGVARLATFCSMPWVVGHIARPLPSLPNLPPHSVENWCDAHGALAEVFPLILLPVRRSCLDIESSRPRIPYEARARLWVASPCRGSQCIILYAFHGHYFSYLLFLAVELLWKMLLVVVVSQRCHRESRSRCEAALITCWQLMHLSAWRRFNGVVAA